MRATVETPIEDPPPRVLPQQQQPKHLELFISVPKDARVHLLLSLIPFAVQMETLIETRAY